MQIADTDLAISRVRFWEIIDASRQPKPTDLSAHCDALKQQLTNLSREELIAFDETYGIVREELNDFHLWAAAKILNDGCSEDGFDYFKDWIITQGRAVYEAALENPESLADVLSPGYDCCDAETFAYVAGEIYEERYKDYINNETTVYILPFVNEQLSREAAQAKFPKLVAMAKMRQSKA